MPLADLTYYVWSERIIGRIGKRDFNIGAAVSGGGRGGSQPDRSFRSYSAYTQTVKATGQRGGTLPPGIWLIGKPSEYHGKLGRPVSELIPFLIEEPNAEIFRGGQREFERKKARFFWFGSDLPARGKISFQRALPIGSRRSFRKARP